MRRVDISNFNSLHPGGLVVVVVIMIALGAVVAVNLKTSQQCSTLQASFRQIESSNLTVVELWSVGIKTYNNSPYPPIVSNENLIVVGQTCDEVTAFALRTGEVKWRSEQIVNPVSLALDIERNQIYVTAPEQLRALSTLNGQTLWLNESPILQRNGPSVTILADGAALAYARHEGIRPVDPLTGGLSERLNLPPTTFLFYENVAFTDEGSGIIQAIDIADGSVLWVSDVSGYGSLSTETMRPEIQENYLVLRTNSSLDNPVILDRDTGRAAWDVTVPSTVSNVVIRDSVMYILDANARLLLFNAVSGDEIGMIQFSSPQPADLLFSDAGFGGSWITVRDNIIAIYFQDVDTLSVYELDWPEADTT